MSEFALILICPTPCDRKTQPVAQWRPTAPSGPLAGLHIVARAPLREDDLQQRRGLSFFDSSAAGLVENDLLLVAAAVSDAKCTEVVWDEYWRTAFTENRPVTGGFGWGRRQWGLLQEEEMTATIQLCSLTAS